MLRNKILKLSAVALALLPTTVLAASKYSSTSSSGSGEAAAFMIAFYAIYCGFYCVWFFVSIFLWFMTLFMIVDAAKRTDAQLPSKTMWIVLMFIIQPASVFYYFIEKRKLDKLENPS